MTEQLPANIDIEHARLPKAYEQAKTALVECLRIDECKDLSDKAEALASYARMKKDNSLRKMADRIQARAARRMGELLKEFDARGAHRKTEGAHGSSQRDAAATAGISEHQQLQAVRVASIPPEAFEAAVESEKPPTVTALADMGKTPRRKPDKTSDRNPIPEGTYPIPEIRSFAHWSRMTSDHPAMAHRVAKDEWPYLEKDLLEIERLIRNMRSVRPSGRSADVRAIADRAEARSKA